MSYQKTLDWISLKYFLSGKRSICIEITPAKINEDSTVMGYFLPLLFLMG